MISEPHGDTGEAQDPSRGLRASSTESVINALPASIALLDADGFIVAVNDGWRNFGRSNSLGWDGHGVGENYLSVCDTAVGEGSEDAHLAAAGIRAVLSGVEKTFTLEYPCHAPDEKRWFSMTATPTIAGSLSGAVVMHVNITARKRAEEELREGEERYLRQRNALITLTGDGSAGHDDLAAVFRRITETDARTLGVARVSVWRYNKDHTAIQCVDLYELESDRHTSGMVVSAATCPAYFQALSVMDVIAVDDAIHDPRTCEFTETYLTPLGISSMLDAVVRIGGKVEGVLCHEHVGPRRRWTTDEMTFAVAMANLVTVALEGWERRVTLNVVLKVAQAVSTGKGAEFFELLTQNMIEALEADGGMIGKTNPSDLSLVTTLALMHKDHRLGNFRHKVTGTPCEGLALGYACIYDRDVQSHFPEDTWLVEHGVESFVGIPLFDQEGAVSGVMAVFFGAPLEQTALVHSTLKIFAARAAAELERLESDERIHEQASLLDKAQDAILVRDLDNRILYWNKSAERLYGWTADEAVGRSVADLLYLETSQFEEARRAVIDRGDWMGELIQVSKSGDEVVVQGRWTLVRDDHGKPKSILAINTDITEKKRIEAQFLRAQRMESIGTLAGGVAHDLNNVLAPVMMAVDLLRLTITDKHALAIISTIDRSARRGADMVRQVLSFARGVDGERVLIYPADVVRDIEQIIRDSFPKNIELRVELPKVSRPFLGDPTQLHQVMLNLCVNARDAMPGGGQLSITAGTLIVDESYASMNTNAKSGEYVSILVRDTGTGISRQILDKIFDPFFTTKELGSGTGLGLSTVLGIVNSHGGFIDVTSEPGQGTTFTIHFPADPSVGVVLPSESDEELHPRGEGELVLIVDDEQAVREITSETLEAFGYKTLVARDGAEAIAVYAQYQDEIDVVLTDMMMPLMDGPAAIQVLKRMNPKVKIIAASGLTSSGNSSDMHGLGVNCFLPKPYTAHTILAKLKSILRGGAVSLFCWLATEGIPHSMAGILHAMGR